MMMNKKNIDALYSKKQQEVLKFAATNDFFMLINHGAKRSGKTVIDNDLFLMELKRVRKEADRDGVARPQYILAGADLSSLQRNVLVELSNKYDLQFKFDKYNRFELFGVLVCCFGHSKINDMGRIRGMTAYGAYINEASVANENVFNEIKSRCSAPGARLIMDTNPDRPNHWLKRDYIDKADGKTVAEYSWQLDDNDFLTVRYINSIKSSTPSGMFYDRDILGQWVNAEGLVYCDFSDCNYIAAADVPEIKHHFIGFDFGYEHPASIVLLGEDCDGVQYLLREYSARHKNIEHWKSVIFKLYEEFGRIPVYCDSARPDLIESLQADRINASNAVKDVLPGIAEVATRFKERRLLVVSEHVTNFKEEICTYCWKSGTDEPVKTNDDTMDALRYAVYTDKKRNENEAYLNDADYLRGW